MIDFLTRNAFRILIGLCALSALIGLFTRADSGPERVPLMYPLTALISVLVVVMLVRLLSSVLRTQAEDVDAD